MGSRVDTHARCDVLTCTDCSMVTHCQSNKQSQVSALIGQKRFSDNTRRLYTRSFRLCPSALSPSVEFISNLSSGYNITLKLIEPDHASETCCVLWLFSRVYRARV